MGVKPSGSGISSPGANYAAIAAQIPGKLQAMEEERRQALAMFQALNATSAPPAFGGADTGEIVALQSRVDRLERMVDRLLSGAE